MYSGNNEIICYVPMIDDFYQISVMIDGAVKVFV